MFNLNLTRPLAFFDIESTGVNPRFDKIVEISVIKIHPDGNEEVLSSLINPGCPIPPEAINIHGISDLDVADKPFFKDFASELLDFIKDCDLGGFSIKRFDLPLLEEEFKRVGIPYSGKEKLIVDVLSIYHKFEPRDLSAAYRKYCGKELEGAHRSEADVRATIKVLKSQLEKHEGLPRDMGGLHEFCNPRNPDWVDSEGKFIWYGNNVIFNFGKNKGKTLQEVAEESPDFFGWIIKNDFSDEIKKLSQDALKGIFPIKLK